MLVAGFAVAGAQDTNPPKTGESKPVETKAENAFTPEVRTKVVEELNKIVTERCFVPGVDFSKWPTFLEARKETIEKTETETAFAGEINRALREFGISHIRFNTPRVATNRQSGTTAGLGLGVKKTDAGLEITTVLPQGPAGQAGLEVGDVIKEIGGKVADDTAAIRVEPGATLQVKVLKKSGETKDLTLESKTFSAARPETLTWLDDESAVLKIYTFSRGYDRNNIEKLLKEVQDKRAKYLILDLRSNGGGAVNNLQHLLSLLIPDKTDVGTFIGRALADRYAKEKNEPATDPVKIAEFSTSKFRTSRRLTLDPYQGKIAVLINRGSASASEIAASALKETRDAVVVGTRSAGAVLASVYGRLPGGFEIQYPIQDYVTIKGQRLEKNPVVPDLEPERPTDGKDNQPQAALEVLKKKAAAKNFSLR